MKYTGKFSRTICFRKWSRNKFSLLASLSRVVKIGVLCLAYSLVNKAPLMMGQSDTSVFKTDLHEIEEVEVTGRRSQAVFSEVSRLVTIIQREEIEQSGIQSIEELLKFASNVDIRQRGAAGVQADVNIRGGSYDHALILINGVSMNDPQTGHFGMDIPVDMGVVEKIEILEGSAARVLGTGAFTGAINIITRLGNSKSLYASKTLGRYGSDRQIIYTGFPTGLWNNHLAISSSESDGYAYNTDYRINNLYYRGNIQQKSKSVDMQGGMQLKSFGAGGFYSPRFPDQFEKTELYFGSLKFSTGNKWKITPQVHWRRKKDHFLLIRNNPAFYENYHLTDVFGGQCTVSYSKKAYAVWTGIDIRYEHIYSNNIGIESIRPRRVKGTDSTWYTRQYGRTNYRLFHEEDIQLGKLGVTAGIMVNWNSGFDDHPAIIPGLDISYSVSEELTLFSSVNRALHLPTFTDLFYVDPVNQGNLNLDPNTMMSLEGGIKLGMEDIKCTVTGFFTSGRGMTDWLWSYKINKFGPVNLTRHNTWGIASNFTVYLHGWLRKAGFTMINANYMYLDTRKALPDSVSKYYNLKHKFSTVIRQHLTNALSLSWNLSYQDRQGETIGFQPDSGYFSVDNKPFWLVNGKIIYNTLKLQVFFGISNVLNVRYTDAGSVIQPGRCWEAGLVVRFE